MNISVPAWIAESLCNPRSLSDCRPVVQNRRSKAAAVHPPVGRIHPAILPLPDAFHTYPVPLPYFVKHSEDAVARAGVPAAVPVAVSATARSVVSAVQEAVRIPVFPAVAKEPAFVVACLLELAEQGHKPVVAA